MRTTIALCTALVLAACQAPSSPVVITDSGGGEAGPLDPVTAGNYVARASEFKCPAAYAGHPETLEDLKLHSEVPQTGTPYTTASAGKVCHGGDAGVTQAYSATRTSQPPASPQLEESETAPTGADIDVDATCEALLQSTNGADLTQSSEDIQAAVANCRDHAPPPG